MALSLSIVLPMHNEEDAAGPFLEEIFAATAGLPLIEVICVDDASADGTLAVLKKLRGTFETLRILRHAVRSGQSAAVVTGVRAARGEIVATMDGDGQNDPADIRRMYDAFIAARAEQEKSGIWAGPLLVAGQRLKRQDTLIRKISSRVANGVRSRLLDDGVRDTGCGLKLFARADFLRLPAFDHMHRFLPALFRREAGGRVVTLDVNHRPRTRGTSKYGLFDRLWVGIVDIVGVLWLKSRPISRGAIFEETP